MISFKSFYSNKISTTQTLTEGGASGHMSHLFEDINLSFQELKNIITSVLSGKIEVQEKTDGQNLTVTFKGGKLLAARNKSTLKNPMTIEDVAKKFAGRGPIKDAFVNSMRDVERAVSSLSKRDQDEIFRNGQAFMAFEIIYPPTKNVIDYGNRSIIQFHGVNVYDENWNKVGEDKNAASTLFQKLKNAGALNQETFEITGPTVLKLNQDFSNLIPVFIKKLESIRGNLNDNQTIGDWLINGWKKEITPMIKNFKIDTNSELFETIVKRWALDDKSVNKNQIVIQAKNIIEDEKTNEFISWFEDIEKSLPLKRSEIISPLELLIIDIGSQFLSNLTGFVSTSPDQTIKDMKQELERAIKELQTKNIPKATEVLRKNLLKLDAIGRDKIAPTEGVVLMYKGKPYKITGMFGSINQILGIFKFGI